MLTLCRFCCYFGELVDYLHKLGPQLCDTNINNLISQSFITNTYCSLASHLICCREWAYLVPGYELNWMNAFRPLGGTSPRLDSSLIRLRRYRNRMVG